MLTTQYAKMLPGIRINAVDPDFTATDLNDYRGTQSVEEGTDAIIRIVGLRKCAHRCIRRPEWHGSVVKTAALSCPFRLS
jgi:hypothetical protein